MIGMNFTSFLVLLVIAVVVAVIAHYVIRYRYLEGIDSLFGKIAIGWLGGWLGSPVVGHWGFQIGDVYVIPAIVGAIVAILLVVLCFKATAKACGVQKASE